MDKIWAIVLAAGSSTRMKQQKLLLPWQGKTMIEAVIHKILPQLDSNIVVVTGANRYEITEQIRKLPVKICINEDYLDGMLSSVIAGFRALPDDAIASLVFLGDQPQIPVEVIKKIIKDGVKSQKGIVIPVFRGRRGHPVFISIRYKSNIEQLDPSRGLKQLMDDYPDDIEEIECDRPEILRDIDTPEDYSGELNRNDVNNKR